MPTPKVKAAPNQSGSAGLISFLAGLSRVAWWLFALLYIGAFVADIATLIRFPQRAFNVLPIGELGGPTLTTSLTELGWSQPFFLFVFLLPEFIAAAVFLAVGLIIRDRRHNDWFGWFTSLWMVLFGITSSSIFALALPESDPLFAIYYFPLLFSYMGIIVFLFAFPDGGFHPAWTRYFAVAWGLFVLSTVFGDWFDWSSPLSAVVIVPLLGAVLYSQLYRYRKISTASQKEQTKWMIVAIAANVVLVALSSVFDSMAESIRGTGAAGIYVLLGNATEYIANLLLAVAVGIAILRHRLWDIEVVVNRALIYGPLSVILTAIFAVSVALINQTTRQLLGAEATVTAAAVSALIVATFFQPLRLRIEKWINQRIYPENTNLARELVEISDPRISLPTAQLAQLVAERISRLLNSGEGAVYLLEQGPTYTLLAASGQPGNPSGPLELSEKASKELATGQVSTDRASQLLVPLYVPRLRSKELIGVLLVGKRKDGRGYSSDDTRALSELGGEVGTALYAAQLRSKNKA